jgi:COP9 signalosome complex subunit 2
LLTYVKSAVTRNYSEKSINNMLDHIEKGAGDKAAYQCMEQFYSLTLDAFQSTNNERLWLKTNIKLARLWLEKKQFSQLDKKLRELHRACQLPDGTDDPAKGTYSLEIYALEIQMYVETRNNKRLKALYHRALRVKSAVPHPKIMGVIRECGGKMHLSEEKWEEARIDFSEAFRSYDEAGSLQRINILKYLCLTTMLNGSDINPFDSQETQPYKNDPRLSGMMELLEAYQRDDIDRYVSVMQQHPDIVEDEFIRENIDEVNRGMRMKTILKLIAPYTRFSLDFIATHLQISPEEVQDIVSYLIVDGKLKATIDQVTGTVERVIEPDADRVEALRRWSAAMKELWEKVLDEGDGFTADDLTRDITIGDTDMSTRPGRTARLAPPFAKSRGRKR